MCARADMGHRHSITVVDSASSPEQRTLLGALRPGCSIGCWSGGVPQPVDKLVGGGDEKCGWGPSPGHAPQAQLCERPIAPPPPSPWQSIMPLQDCIPYSHNFMRFC